ncbi:uncharacterized protein LOC125016520 [Mugil cephalus]|uniref:uncharacterized protein LOC125016520 n=1 Tax=Mugil cephalus TaxID=48193 RepID=UPI001FB7E0D4|nr:uncharacterized protein LOC125016520 [Mugil cephalus]
MFVLFCLLWRLFHGTLGGPVQHVTWSDQVNQVQVQPHQGAAPSPLFYQLPMFLHAPGPLVSPELFRPVPRQMAISSGITALLLPQTRQHQEMEGTDARAVEVWCGFNAVSVRVDRTQLRAWTVPSLFRLGSCEASRVSPRFLDFHYGLTECDGQVQVFGGQLVYTHLLHYTPAPDGYVIRVPPLKVPIHCHYNRFHYSYQVGYRPQVQLTTLVKNIQSNRVFSLTVCNAQWEPVLPDQWFPLGEPVYFVAQAGFLLPGERLYVDACYATSSKDPEDTLRVDIITNYGCMTDSRREGSRSQFLFRGGNVLKFSIDTFLFRAASPVQYLHCSVSVSFTSSPTAKSCNYNQAAGWWEELKASPSLCSCCNYICSDTQPAVNTVSSSGWFVDQRDKMTPRTKMAPFQTEGELETVHPEEERKETIDVHLKEKHTSPFESHIINEKEKERVLAEKKDWMPGTVSPIEKTGRERSDSDIVAMKAGSQWTESETYGFDMSDEIRPHEKETPQGARELMENMDSVNGLSRDNGTNDGSGAPTITRNNSTKYNASSPGSTEEAPTAVITASACSNSDQMSCSSTHGAVQQESSGEHGTTSTSGVNNVSDSAEYKSLSGSGLTGIHSSTGDSKTNSGVIRKEVDGSINKSVDVMSAERQAGYSINSEGSGRDGLLQIRGLESGTSAQDFDSGVEEGDGLHLSQFTGGLKTKGQEYSDGIMHKETPHTVTTLQGGWALHSLG